MLTTVSSTSIRVYPVLKFLHTFFVILQALYRAVQPLHTTELNVILGKAFLALCTRPHRKGFHRRFWRFIEGKDSSWILHEAHVYDFLGYVQSVQSWYLCLWVCLCLCSTYRAQEYFLTVLLQNEHEYSCIPSYMLKHRNQLNTNTHIH